MARIAGLSGGEAGPYLTLAYHFTRRSIRQLTGRRTDPIFDPIESCAHLPRLLRGYALLEQATAELHRIDRRPRPLAELKAATLSHREYCIDLGPRAWRPWGVTDEDLLALPSYQTSALFTKLDKCSASLSAIFMSSVPSTCLIPSTRQSRRPTRHTPHCKLNKLRQPDSRRPARTHGPTATRASRVAMPETELDDMRSASQAGDTIRKRAESAIGVLVVRTTRLN